MNRKRFRKASVQLENLEAKIVLSTVSSGPELHPVETPSEISTSVVDAPDVQPPGEHVDAEPREVIAYALLAPEDDSNASSTSDDSLVQLTMIDANESVSDTDGDADVDPEAVPLMATTGLPDEPVSHDGSATDDEGVVVPISMPIDTEAPPEVQTGIPGGGPAGNRARIGRGAPLSGNARGGYTVASPVPGQPGNSRLILNGQGRFLPFGQANVSGILNRTGQIRGQDATGTLRGDLVVSRPEGRVSIRLDSVDPAASPKIPNVYRLNATIVEATGSWRDLRGLGSALVRFQGSNFGLGLNLSPPRR